jgi:hypothetical protein
MRFHRLAGAASLALLLCAPALAAQGTLEDYRRAAALNQRLAGLTVDVAQPPTWIGTSDRFWYRKTVTGGTTFVLVDAATRERRPRSPIRGSPRRSRPRSTGRSRP